MVQAPWLDQLLGSASLVHCLCYNLVLCSDLLHAGESAISVMTCAFPAGLCWPTCAGVPLVQSPGGINVSVWFTLFGVASSFISTFFAFSYVK